MRAGGCSCSGVVRQFYDSKNFPAGESLKLLWTRLYLLWNVFTVFLWLSRTAPCACNDQLWWATDLNHLIRFFTAWFKRILLQVFCQCILSIFPLSFATQRNSTGTWIFYWVTLGSLQFHLHLNFWNQLLGWRFGFIIGHLHERPLWLIKVCPRGVFFSFNWPTELR